MQKEWQMCYADVLQIDKWNLDFFVIGQCEMIKACMQRLPLSYGKIRKGKQRLTPEPNKNHQQIQNKYLKWVHLRNDNAETRNVSDKPTKRASVSQNLIRDFFGGVLGLFLCGLRCSSRTQ